jgi:hypothetical protein
MLRWFADRGDETVDDSTVKKKIRHLYDVLKHGE